MNFHLLLPHSLNFIGRGQHMLAVGWVISSHFLIASRLCVWLTETEGGSVLVIHLHIHIKASHTDRLLWPCWGNTKAPQIHWRMNVYLTDDLYAKRHCCHLSLCCDYRTHDLMMQQLNINAFNPWFRVSLNRAKTQKLSPSTPFFLVTDTGDRSDRNPSGSVACSWIDSIMDSLCVWKDKVRVLRMFLDTKEADGHSSAG